METGCEGEAHTNTPETVGSFPNETATGSISRDSHSSLCFNCSNYGQNFPPSWPRESSRTDSTAGKANSAKDKLPVGATGPPALNCKA